jgi:hypothetical protein
MKVILIIIGSLGALYAVVAILQFARTLMTRDPATAYGSAEIAASVVPICLGLIVSLFCFQRALRKTKE